MIAIHDHKGSFSERWIEVCEIRKLEYKIVNCLSSDIIEDLENVDILLWHWNHNKPADKLVAHHVIYSAELMGIKVFPNISTCWSFDDKLSQKYQLEAINAPLIKTSVFFDAEKALSWLISSEFPQVFKLRCGAGSENVSLVHSKSEAEKIVKKAFSKGFDSKPPHIKSVKDHIKKRKSVGSQKKFDIIGKAIRYLQRSQRNKVKSRMLGREISYVLFQEFVPNNQYDIRITVIGNKAFGFTRNVRPDDWRASGSGDINYDIKKIDIECIKIAFDVAEKLNLQSVAFDFVKKKEGEPEIVEISYCYNAKAVYDCNGYWNRDFKRLEGHFWPQDEILDLMLDLN